MELISSKTLSLYDYIRRSDYLVIIRIKHIHLINYTSVFHVARGFTEYSAGLPLRDSFYPESYCSYRLLCVCVYVCVYVRVGVCIYVCMHSVCIL